MLRDQRPRFALDYRVMTGLSGPMIRRVRGFVSSEHRFAGREASRAEGEAGRVTQYLVSVTRPMLSGPNRPLQSAEILIDAETAGHDYPHAAPMVVIVSSPLPFTHRVHPRTGVVCIGSVWIAARGRILMGHLLIHTLRLLGFDEPPNYDGGYNPAAYGYWRERLRGEALPCSMPYPILPEDVTHTRPQQARPAFAASGTVGTPTNVLVFRARGDAAPSPSPSVLFRPAGARS